MPIMTDQVTTAEAIFDPVLCELAYVWFCPPGGLVLDPFAGGSVRGIVAAYTGRRYVGIDLSEAQVQANRAQARDILDPPANACEWLVGDAQDAAVLTAPRGPADFIFTSPPIPGLDRPGDDPCDLAGMSFDNFLVAYHDIIGKCCSRLRNNRFACFVVGDARGPHGMYMDIPGETIDAFRDAGLGLYNEAILVTNVGALSLHAGKQFEASRKLGRTHLHALVFIKGDASIATKDIGPCQFSRDVYPGDDRDELPAP